MFIILILLILWIVFGTYLFTRNYIKDKPKSMHCRMCGTKKNMAILYYDDGLCRSCFDELNTMGILKNKE